MTLDESKQLAYAYDRKEHTARILVETNPQIAINEAEKGRTEQEIEFAMDTAGIPKEGFNGH